MRHLVCILTLTLLASCVKQEAMLSSAGDSESDSLVLRVAVLPTQACLPAFVAERAGLWDSLGLDVSLLRYEAQIDTDTALVRQRADVAMSDLVRAQRLNSDSFSVCPLLSVDEPMALVAVKGKRVSRVHQLKERMIAISRLSITDYWCDRFIEETPSPESDFYRPQVHSIPLRAEMLRTGLMDAALLPEPYCAWAVATENVLLKQTAAKDIRLAAWVANAQLLDQTDGSDRARRFVEAYQKATEMINSGECDELVKTILHEEYGMPQAMADTLQLPTIGLGTSPRSEDAETARQWLNSKLKIHKEKIKGESLEIREGIL